MTGETVTERPPGAAALAPASRSWSSRIGRFLLILVLVAVAVEIALRLFMATQLGPRVLLYGTPLFRQDISVAKRKESEWQGTPTSGGRPEVHEGYSKYFPNETKTDFNEKGEQITYRINSHGFRAPDFEIAKAPGVVRIVALGGSSTFGFGSNDNETYPSQLQARLNERCKQKKYEVINLGIPHLNSSMIRELFVAEGIPLKPDIVTFYEGYNDTSTNPGVVSVESVRDASRTNGLTGAAYRALIPVYRWIRDWSMSLLLVDNVLQRSTRSTPSQVAAYRSTDRVSKFLSNLAGIRDAAQREGAKFIVVSQQAKSFIVPRESIHGVTLAEERRRVEARVAAGQSLTLQELYFLAHTDMMDGEAKWASAEHIPYVDGIAKLDDRRELLHTWVHLTPEANAILADAIADEVLPLTCP
jgi:hypothetical protein